MVSNQVFLENAPIELRERAERAGSDADHQLILCRLAFELQLRKKYNSVPLVVNYTRNQEKIHALKMRRKHLTELYSRKKKALDGLHSRLATVIKV